MKCKLRIYLWEKGITITQFAKKCHFTRAHISNHINGNGTLSERGLTIVSQNTDGEVTERELREWQKYKNRD